MSAVPKAITTKLEKYALTAQALGDIELRRSAAIAAINADCDREAAPHFKAQAKLLPDIEAWWSENAAAMTGGQRKSIELGGCMIGTTAGRAGLALADAEPVIIAALAGERRFKEFLRVTTSLDKVALLKAVDGKLADDLAGIGVTKRDGVESFWIKPINQSGSLTG